MRVRSFLAFAALAVTTASSASRAAESARLMTYAADGKTSFALSLAAEASQAEVAAVDVVVLFDTSASQQGPYRESGIAALEAMLAELRPTDRVQIMAVDLEAVPLMKGFAAANSPEVAQAIAAIRDRAPLGSTNMVRGLHGAIDTFEQARSTSRAITYIGDGISMADMLDASTLRPVVDLLQATRTAVSSYAIGPETDAMTLAALANQTGGNLSTVGALAVADEGAGVTDIRANEENERAAQVVGKRLAEWSRGTVLWPTAVQLPDALGQVFPSPVPPLRADRDSVLLGETAAALADAMQVQVTAVGVDGAAVELAWNVAAEAPQADHAYLSELVSSARANGGVALPTLGVAGLTEAARLVGAKAD